jgi:UDP-N-acetylmuramate--alanine ligase
VEYGFSAPDPVGLWATEVVPDGVGVAFVVHRRDESVEDVLGGVRVQVPGRHNALNALAAVAVGLEAGIPFPAIREGLERFRGAGRRLERLGEAREILVVDDYAHHPTEIRATLAAVGAAYPGRRVVAVFQPHLYSRTRDFLNEFADALSEADVILLTDIYPAREKPIPGVRVVDIVHRIAHLAPGKTLLYLPDKRDVVGALAWVAQPGDLVLTMGAGDINEAAEAFLASMRAHA